MNTPLDHIAFQVYGPRNQLLGHGRIPTAVIPEFAQLLAEAQLVKPAYTPDMLVRWMIKKGHAAVKRAIQSGQIAVP